MRIGKRLIALLAAAGMFVALGNVAQADLVGNDLTERQYPSDNSHAVLFTNFIAMPRRGTVDAVSVPIQDIGNQGTRDFNIYLLRPTGNLDEYDVVYDSGNIVPAGDDGTIVSFAFPNGITQVQAGDLFAHYGNGIPYSDDGGTNANNAIAIYYPVGAAPVQDTTITVGVGDYPSTNYVRDYASAVEFTVADFATLTWDQLGSDTWSSASWTGGPPASPDADSDVILAATNTDTVTVAADASAFSLTADGGALVISGGSTLSTAAGANFAAGTALTLGDGATLSAGSGASFVPGTALAMGNDATLATAAGTLDTLTAAGNATVNVAANGLQVGSFEATGAGTFTKQGAGTLLLDNSAGTGVAAAETVFKIADGMLEATGADPLGGAPAVELAGGSLLLRAPRSEGGGALPADDLVLHLDAGSIGANDGDLVAVWNDLSGQGNHAAQVAPVNQPSYQSDALGGQPVVRFDGDDVLTTDAETPFSNPYTIFSVSQMEGTQSFRLVSSAAQGVNWLLGDHDGLRDRMYAGGWVSSGSTGDTDPHIYAAAGTGSLTSFYEGGRLLASNSSGTLAPEQIALGASTSFANPIHEPSKGDVAEILIYSTALSPAELNAAGSYLAHKYGLDTSYYAPDSALDMSTTEVVVSENSSLEVAGAASAAFGQLAMHNGVLTINGGYDGVAFAGTTIAADASAVGFNLQVPISIGPIDVEAVDPVVISKSGSVDLVLTPDNVGAAGFAENVTFDVQGGTLVGLHGANPFDRAALQLGGGELVLAGSEAGADVAFDNALTVAADGTLTVGSGGVGAAGPMTVTLGSAANGVALTGGDLALKLTDDYSLNIAGPISGPGRLNVTEGNVTLSGGGDVGSMKVTDGTLNTAAELQVGLFEVAGGTVNTNDSQVIVSDRLRLGDMPYTMEEGTLAVSGSDLLAEANITLGGGTLMVGAGGAPTGVQAYYSFDDSGDPGRDDSGNGFAGDVVDAIWTAEGRSGGALEFDGAAAYVNATMDISETAYASSMWFKTESDGNGLFAAHVEPLSGASDRHLWLSGGNLNARTWNNEAISTTDLDLADGEWHHVVHTFGGDEGGQKLYIDGELAAEGAKDFSDFDWQESVTIGFSNDGEPDYFEGLIDEVFIYDRALSADDVEALYSPTGALIDQPNVNLVVTVDSTLSLGTLDDATFGNLRLADGAALTIDGAAVSFNDLNAGDGVSLDGILLLRGTMTPAGTLTIDGELEMEEDAVYVSQLSEAGNGLVEVTADAFIAGTLALEATGKIGAAGDYTRTVMAVSGDEGEIVDEFGVVPAAGDHLGHGVFHRDVRYPDFTSVEVDVFQSEAGDADGDRKIDNADLQAILGAGSFGNGAGFDWTQGDFNGDTMVDNSDLQLILATGLFGTGSYAATGGGVVAVPEPGTLVLLGCGLLGLLLGRRRRRRMS